jgi:hypothetical protein
VAISNQRIQKIDHQNVNFLYKDYKDAGKTKTMQLSGIELLRWFCMHILPKGFVKVRYCGIMSNRYSKQTAMYRKPQTKPKKETTLQRIARLANFDICLCPFCKKGTMHVVELLPRIRSLVKFLFSKYKKTNAEN